jgi:hypothetical protein
MVVGVSDAVLALKTAFDIAKGIKDLDNQAAISSAVIDLQSAILEAQEAALKARTEKEQLEGQVKALLAEIEAAKDWQEERLKYRLRQIESGIYVYMLDQPPQGEPLFALCVPCFEQSIKSIIQSNGSSFVDKHLFECPTCQTKYRAHIPDLRKLLEYAEGRQ